MPRVYVSSTYSDLRDYRDAAASAVRSWDCQPVAMEDYVAADHRPLDKCLDDVRGCDVYVGIIGWRYGFRPPGHQKSITQLEYECARDAGIPCLIFIVDADAPWADEWTDSGEDAVALQSFKQQLTKRHTVKFFSSPQQLETDVTGALGRQLHAGMADVKIPELLPYMSDRSHQRDQLADAIDTHNETRPQRPLLVFVDGDERQAHGAFIDRLQRVTLPQLLELDPEAEPVHRFDFEWAEPVGNTDERIESLHKRLAEKLLGRRRATVEELAAEVARHRCPVMINTSIFSREWRSDEPKLVQDYVDSWTRWPDLPTGESLIVTVNFKYRDAGQAGFIERRKIEKRNKAVAGFVEGFDFSRIEGLTGVRLDRLTSIRETDVMEWIESHASDFCREARGAIRDPLVLAERLTPWVRDFYGRSADRDDAGGIPMAVLAVELRRQLNDCMSEGGV